MPPAERSLESRNRQVVVRHVKPELLHVELTSRRSDIYTARPQNASATHFYEFVTLGYETS